MSGGGLPARGRICYTGAVAREGPVLAAAAGRRPDPIDEKVPAVESPVSDELPETSASETPAVLAADVEPAIAEVPPPEAALAPEVELEAQPIPAPEPPSSGMVGFGVGAALRSAREKKGKSVAECAQLLCIRHAFLDALESGRHQDLPGGTYASGFLRTYAEYLGLDGEEMVRRFRDEGAGGFTNRTELSFPSPVSEGRIPGGAVIFLGLVLAAIVYGGWHLLSSPESKVAEMVPPLPDRLSAILNRQAALTGESRGGGAADAAKPEDESAKVKEDVVPPSEGEDDKSAAANPVPQTETKPAEPASAPTLTPPVETASVKPAEAKVEPVKVEPPKVEPVKVEPPKAEAVKAADPIKVEPPKTDLAKTEPPKQDAPKADAAKVEPAKADVASASAPAATPAVDGKVYGGEYADSRVMLRAASDDCWIQVREMDGSLLVSRLLRRGDSFRVPNRPGLNLMVGNAGSLEVTIDGRKASALGAVGQVRRDIRLDPDKLQSGG